MKFLALDTASAQCSVALFVDGELIVRAAATAREHAQLILPMVDSALAEAGLKLTQLHGIAFGRGPGSFTGVRVAAAVAQGLAVGADLPVLPVSDLRALAAQALRRQRMAGLPLSGNVLACMDARMGEVYWAAYGCLDGVLSRDLVPERVSPPGEVIAGCPRPCNLGAGMGLAAWPQIADSLQMAAQQRFADAEPHAEDVAALALDDLAHGSGWLDASLALPVYVRDQVAVAKVQV